MGSQIECLIISVFDHQTVASVSNLVYGTLHKKCSFPLWIYSVNVTKSAGNCGFGHIY